MKYKLATLNVPRPGYAEDDWRSLPAGERIIHVFAQAMTPDGSLVVLIERDEEK